MVSTTKGSCNNSRTNRRNRRNSWILQLYREFYHVGFHVSKSSSSRNSEKFSFNRSCRLFIGILENSEKCPGMALLWSFFIVNCKPSNYRLYLALTFMFLKFSKIPEIKRAVESRRQALIDSLQNSCSKELFGKVPGRDDYTLKGLHPGNFGSNHFFTRPEDGCFGKLK